MGWVIASCFFVAGLIALCANANYDSVTDSYDDDDTEMDDETEMDSSSRRHPR